jgi:hypothetical protein
MALCVEALSLAYQNRGLMGLIGASTYNMLQDATQPALFRMLEENRIPFDFTKSDNTLEFTEPRSRVIFRSLDEYERLRGTNLAWFGVDELTYAKEEAWLRLLARLREPKAKRLCGFGVWTPNGHNWVHRRFIGDRLPGYEAILAKPFENKFLLETNPSFYEGLKQSYDQTLYQQEVLGLYVNRNGHLVYSSFDREVHVKRVELESWLPVMWSLDFNVNPMSSVIAQQQGGITHVAGEIVIGHAKTFDACDEFVRRIGRHPGGVEIYGDASGANQHTTGDTDFEVVRQRLEAAGLKATFHVPPANPRVRDRINLVNSKLKSAVGRVEVVIDGSCVELIQDFEQVTYKDGSGEIDKERDRGRTHASDALGYLLCELSRPSAPCGEQRRPLLVF